GPVPRDRLRDESGAPAVGHQEVVGAVADDVGFLPAIVGGAGALHDAVAEAARGGRVSAFVAAGVLRGVVGRGIGGRRVTRGAGRRIARIAGRRIGGVARGGSRRRAGVAGARVRVSAFFRAFGVHTLVTLVVVGLGGATVGIGGRWFGAGGQTAQTQKQDEGRKRSVGHRQGHLGET